ncbi:MAG: NAD(P)/FAD-dependent oxidoreductase [Candidatus Jordarchaeaceae archaeon]
MIGCGPSGAIASQKAAKKGVKVAIIEEHPHVGLPEHCAGLISTTGFRRLNINIPKECILNRVKGATFYSPQGTAFSVSRRNTQAYVVNRPLLDQYLASLAQKENVSLFTGTKVLAVKMGEIKTLKVSQKREQHFTAKVIIDAEGVRGKFVREMGLAPVSRGIIPGVQIEVKNAQVNPEEVEIFLGNKVAPGFFAWMIPTSEDTARVGLGAHHHALKYLEKFIKNHPIASKKLRRAVPVKKFGGSIILSGPIPKTYADGFLVVGDAAGQVKPTTGGGVIMGGLCAQIAGEVAAQAVTEKNVSGGRLSAYQKKWKKLLSREFNSMLLARKILNRMDDRTLNRLFETLTKREFHRVIEEVGDMDFESEVIRKILLKPTLSISILLNFLASFIPIKRRQEKNIQ